MCVSSCVFRSLHAQAACLRERRPASRDVVQAVVERPEPQAAARSHRPSSWNSHGDGEPPRDPRSGARSHSEAARIAALEAEREDKAHEAVMVLLAQFEQTAEVLAEDPGDFHVEPGEFQFIDALDNTAEADVHPELHARVTEQLLPEPKDTRQVVKVQASEAPCIAKQLEDLIAQIPAWQQAPQRQGEAEDDESHAAEAVDEPQAPGKGTKRCDACNRNRRSAQHIPRAKGGLWLRKRRPRFQLRVQRHRHRRCKRKRTTILEMA